MHMNIVIKKNSADNPTKIAKRFGQKFIVDETINRGSISISEPNNSRVILYKFFLAFQKSCVHKILNNPKNINIEIISNLLYLNKHTQ